MLRSAVRLLKLSAVLGSLVAIAGCASNDGLETAAFEKTAIAPGKARVTITRTDDFLFVGMGAAITLNGREVANLSAGGRTTFDMPSGSNEIAVSAWGHPGRYAVKVQAVAGQKYALEVAPRGATVAPTLLFGMVGSAIEASSSGEGKAGAFELRAPGAAQSVAKASASDGT